MTYRYMVAGLKVESDREMSFLGNQRRFNSETADVIIRTYDYSHPSRPTEITSKTSFTFCAKEGLVFQITEGKQILVFKDENTADRDLAIYLIGSAWGVLCHQRDIFPLHCSSVSIDGHAFAFAAQSGGGKSSLAAGLSSRGLAHFCDDVAILSLEQDQSIVAHPMPKGIKLWRDATEALGFDPHSSVTSDNRIEKYYVNTNNISNDNALELKCIYLLSFDSEAKSSCIEKLRPDEALMNIYRNVYRVEWLHLIGNSNNVLSQARKIVERIPVLRFTRPRNFDEFEGSVSVLISHMESQLENGKGNKKVRI